MNKVSVRLVFDRKHVATKKHQASVQLEVMYERKRKYFGTGIKLYTDQWGKDCKVKNHPQSLLFNQQIADMVANIYDFAHQLEAKNIPFSFDELQAYLSGKPTGSSKSFLDFMRERIETRQVGESTKVRHRCILRALEEFGEIQTFDDITFQAITHWDEFARKRCTQQSSVYNYHKVLKIFVREAHANQLIHIDPYMSMRLDRGNSYHRKYLTKEELKRIEDKKIDNRSLQQVRDVFLFCCYTGLAYADVFKFDFTKAEMTNGMYRIRDLRCKTGTEFNISLIDKAMDILKRYNYTLPIISNQKYNEYLKVLGAFCEVKKSLTSHVARHTFATTVALANGVRIEVISKMLGHTNIQTTQIYAKICQAEVDQEFDRLNMIV